MGDEDVTPLLARTVVDEDVDAGVFFDLEPRRVDLEAARTRSALAHDEEAVAGLQHDLFSALVVPIDRMPPTLDVRIGRPSPHHLLMMPVRGASRRASLVRVVPLATHSSTATVGTPAPSFSLLNASGERIGLDDLVTRGPVVLVFLRGFA
jgi:hypothetical protein